MPAAKSWGENPLVKRDISSNHSLQDGLLRYFKWVGEAFVMSFFYRFVFLIAACTTVGCAYQAEVLYTDGVSLRDFTRQMAHDLQAGVDKYSNSVYDKQYVEDGMDVYRTEIVPRAGISALDSSYRNYCMGVGGEYNDWYCYRGIESSPIFYVSVNVRGEYAGHPNVVVTTYQGNNDAAEARVFVVAKRNGYQTQESKDLARSRSERSTRLRAARIEEAKQRRASEQRRREALAAQTRSKVIQKGAQICPVFRDAETYCMSYGGCYTQDFNPANNKLYVSIGGNRAWDHARNWYACEK